MKVKSKNLLVFFLLFSGIVIGSLIGELFVTIPALSWLGYGLKFGLENPIRLNLGVISLSLGFSIDLNISCIICTFLTLFFGLKIFK